MLGVNDKDGPVRFLLLLLGAGASVGLAGVPFAALWYALRRRQMRRQAPSQHYIDAVREVERASGRFDV